MTEPMKVDSKSSSVAAVCCLAIIGALVLGVGLASHLVVRHIVQTLPLWAGGVGGFRRSRAPFWVVLPRFLFWLALMSLIWAYLLGISHLLSGNFSSIEIAMTFIVGVAALIGIAGISRLKSFLSPVVCAGLFIAMSV